MKKMSQARIEAADLYHLLCFEGFACWVGVNKGILTCLVRHEFGTPIPASERKKIAEIVKEWLKDHHPYFPDTHSDTLSGTLSDTPGDSPGDSLPCYAFRESLASLRITINLKRVREAERNVRLNESARDVCNLLLQNRDVYGKEISIRDIEELTGQSFRHAGYVLQYLEEKKVAKRNGHLKTSGRDLNMGKLKEFLRRGK